jgi:hypothetical protein
MHLAVVRNALVAAAPIYPREVSRAPYAPMSRGRPRCILSMFAGENGDKAAYVRPTYPIVAEEQRAQLFP